MSGSRARAGWRAGLLLREAVKNVFTAGGGALVVLCVAVVGGSGAVAFEAARADAFTAYVEQLRLDGRNTVTFTGALTGAAAFEIDRASCEGLSATPGVVRAGLVVAGQPVDTEQYGPFVPVAQVSTGVLPGLRDGLIVPGSALGAPVQELTVSVDGAPLAARVGDPQPPTTGLNSAIATVLPAAQQWGPACLVEIGPYRRSADVVPALAAQLVTSGGEVAAFEPYTGPADVTERYRTDPARFLAWVVGIFGAVLAVIRTWAGASASAAYRLSGTTPVAHMVMLVTEQALVAGVMACSASLAAVAISGELLAPAAVLMRAVQGALLWVVVYGLGAARLLRSDPTILAKDR